jgi:hypothetical protein
MREIIFRVVAVNADDLSFAVLNFPPVPGADLDAEGTAARWKKGGAYRGGSAEARSPRGGQMPRG